MYVNFYFFLVATHERRSVYSTSSWETIVPHGSFSVYTILDNWWSNCGLHVNETRLPGFYVQIAALNFQHFSSKDDIGSVSPI